MARIQGTIHSHQRLIGLEAHGAAASGPLICTSEFEGPHFILYSRRCGACFFPKRLSKLCKPGLVKPGSISDRSLAQTAAFHRSRKAVSACCS